MSLDSTGNSMSVFMGDYTRQIGPPTKSNNIPSGEMVRTGDCYPQQFLLKTGIIHNTSLRTDMAFNYIPTTVNALTQN